MAMGLGFSLVAEAAAMRWTFPSSFGATICCPSIGLDSGGCNSSPSDDVDDRADWVRLKNFEDVTSDEETGKDERVVILGRGGGWIVAPAIVAGGDVGAEWEALDQGV